jgi:hypothetical protein
LRQLAFGFLAQREIGAGAREQKENRRAKMRNPPRENSRIVVWARSVGLKPVLPRKSRV